MDLTIFNELWKLQSALRENMTAVCQELQPFLLCRAAQVGLMVTDDITRSCEQEMQW